VGNLIKKEFRQGSTLGARAQALCLSQSATPVDCFRPPGWDFQHPKGKNHKKMTTDSCSYKKQKHGLRARVSAVLRVLAPLCL